jgi:hypothetical protein
MANLPAGGRSDALIATPTRLDALSSNTLRATPIPEKKAIGIPAKKPCLVDLPYISDVGQEEAILVQ